MSIVVQTQQANQAAIAVSIGSAWSCTPHLPDWRWHVHFEDFEAITGHKVSADALRAFETMTNTRIIKLCEAFDIPDDYLPNEDDLWIEASNPDLEFWTLGVQEQSTYSFALREKTEPGRAKSLLELGFLRRRFVARPGRYEVAPVATTIYLDVTGAPFIVVDDDKQGYYVDADGELHSAADEGYTVMRRQYLYGIERIKAEFAGLAGQSPPAPMPRWHSLQRTKKSAAQPRETTKSTPMAANASKNSHAAQGVRDDEIQDILAESVLFANKNNTDLPSLSLDSDENSQGIVELHNNSTELLSAPWCAETLIALASHHLAIPDPATCDEEQWRRDWLLPAQWLIEHTDDLDCSRAWEIIELHIAAMIAGPTWHAREATKPFTEYGTLRHVVGTKKGTQDLDGHNWISTAKALEKERWADYVHIAYTGPSIFEESAQSSSTQSSPSTYAQGYSAHVVESTAQPLDDVAHPAQSIEVVAQVEDDTAQSDAQSLPAVEVVAGKECAVDNEQSAQSMSPARCEEETAQSVCNTEELGVIAQPEESAQNEEATQYYTGTELALQIIEGDEQGMTSLVAARLRTLIRRDYPDIIIANQKIDGYCLVALKVALDTWYYLGSLADWNEQSPETQEAVALADRYGQQRAASDGNGELGGQGPPGDALVGEEGGDSTVETREER